MNLRDVILFFFRREQLKELEAHIEEYKEHYPLHEFKP